MVENFGEILKNLRNEHHLTQGELLARLPDERHQNYDVSEVSKWESGRRRPPEDVVEAFESVFSTPPGYLLEAAGYTRAAKYRRLTARNQQLQALSDVATHLRDSLSRVGPEDWAIWGLHDTGEPPLTSEAGLRIWIDRGKLVVSLVVEQDHRFSLFISNMKAAFPEFNEYSKWKASLTDFVGACWTVAHEIWRTAEHETGLRLSFIPEMGRGHLLNVPRFIYEFALRHYRSGHRPDLVVLQDNLKRYKLVPKDLHDYILAVGSEDEMVRCQKSTISLCSEYAGDERVSEIEAKAVEIRKQAEPFLNALSTVLEEPSNGRKTAASDL